MTIRGVHQILAGASRGDAITNLAIELRTLLRRVMPSEIYARHVDPSLHGDVLHLHDYNPPHWRNVLVYHASIGEPQTHGMLMERREPVVLVYHNLTPARFFTRWDPAFADLLQLGRLELARLRPRVALALADSAYNAAELQEMGYDDVRVVPPVLDARRLADVEDHDLTANHLEKTFSAPIILAIGQLLPHKRPDFLIRAAHIASTYLGVDAHVVAIGPHRLAAYSEALSRQVRELNLHRFHIVGRVTNSELATYLRRASMFVSASEHEGFCVPLLEAMSFDVPVLARGFAAVPETAGGAALLMPPEAGPAFFAEGMAELLWNAKTADSLRARGRERVSTFETIATQTDYIKALLEVA